MENYYEILGVKPFASEEDIKKSYYELIKKYHPDVYEGDKLFADKKTREINEAFTILKDENSRKKYDRKLKDVLDKQIKKDDISKEDNVSAKENNHKESKAEEKTNKDEKIKDTKKNNDVKKDNSENKNIKENKKVKKMGTKIAPFSKELKDKKILNAFIIILSILLVVTVVITIVTFPSIQQ